MKIYVVFGTTGEYSDRMEWTVKAFTDEGKAKELVLKASEVARVIYKKRNDYDYVDDDLTNEFDPKFRIDYTGTSYYIEEVDLEQT